MGKLKSICSREKVNNRRIHRNSLSGIKVFLQSSSLHGLKYIADEQITTFERSFYAIAFLGVIICSAFFISNVYLKWSANPIIISTSPLPTYTTSIPFPAITICSLNQALNSSVVGIKKGSPNYSLLMSICSANDENSEVTNRKWSAFRDMLKKVAQPCEEMIIFCQFGAVSEDCSNLFVSILTDDGLCCTFNAVHPKYLLRNYTEENQYKSTSNVHVTPIDWTPEKGFSGVNFSSKFYPRIARGTGSRMGLTIVLNTSALEYYCSSAKGFGFKVLVHNPIEQPKIGNFGKFISNGKEFRIPISPSFQNANPDIKNIPISKRHCVFSDEGNLSYYQTYSRKNCELECESRIILERCNCTLYYLPILDPESRICDTKDYACTRMTQTKIESADSTVSCEGCYPACYELSYSWSLSSVDIVDKTYIKRTNFNLDALNTSGDDISILHFFYSSNYFHSITKEELFGFTDFLSNTGGLLGLFMGFSIFSLIEIIYFVTLRPSCQYLRNHKEFIKDRTTTVATVQNYFLGHNSENGNLNSIKNINKNETRNLNQRKEINILKIRTRSNSKKILPYCD